MAGEQKTLARKRFGEFTCQNPYCQKIFSGYRGNKNHYCSKRCNRRINPSRQQKTCERCGAIYILKATTNAGRFCSMACRRNPAKICQYCGREYHKAAKYCCSKKCEMKAKTRLISERFWEKVWKTEKCWLWQGNVNRFGYGTIGISGGKTKLAHRISYEFANGPIAPGLNCLHACDNPPCVNPDHLKLGTQLENMRDMHDRQRAIKGYRSRSVRKRQWRLILNFYKHRCALCECGGIKLVQDHYLPVAKGGETHWANVWPLCISCNRKKAAKVIGILPPHVEALRNIIGSHRSSRERRGIYWDNNRRVWRVQIYQNKKNVQIGTFKLREDATRAFHAASPEIII